MSMKYFSERHTFIFYLNNKAFLVATAGTEPSVRGQRAFYASA